MIIMITKKLVLLFTLLLFPKILIASELDYVDNICYYMDSSTKEAVVMFHLDEDYTFYSGDITIPSTINYKGIDYIVSSIIDYCFGGCSLLTSVTLPNTIVSIGKHAFEGCSKLTSVNIPNKVTVINDSTFMNCSSLTAIKLHDNITEIGEYAFFGCSSIKSINIPSNITTIKDRTFYNCTSLERVGLSQNLTSIGVRAFFNCKKLNTIVIPKNVKEIKSGAFNKCNSLTMFFFEPIDPPSLPFFDDYFCNNVKVYVPIQSLEKYEKELITVKNIIGKKPNTVIG